MTPNQVLNPRALNRATLARQMLSSRTPLPLVAAIEHLVGVHAQIPAGPYVGLLARLDGFTFPMLSTMLNDRRVVRTALQRATIHLVTAQDCLRLRPVVQPALDRDLRANATHGPPMRNLDLDELVATGRRLLDEQPRTPAELGALLQQRWPDRPSASLAYAIRNLAALVQVPPRGIWGRSGQTRHANVQTWLGRPLEHSTSPDELILRYLAAFGPATVADAQTWSGLTRLGEVVDRLRPRLVVFHDDHGRELFDLPDADRPDPDTPTSPRLLPEFDNVFLSHADRRRIIPGGLTFAQLTQKWGLRTPLGGTLRGTVLVDGLLDGAWRTTIDGDAATIMIQPFRRLSQDETAGLTDEGARLLDSIAPAPRTHHVQLTPREETLGEPLS